MNPATKSLQDQIDQYNHRISESQEIIDDPNTDSEFKTLASEDIAELQTQIGYLQSAIEDIENPQQNASVGGAEATTGDCIVELRAGTGGDEAGLFASDLFVMYARFAEIRKWKVQVISKNEGGLGNLKEIVFEINGKGSPSPYELLEYESGVHRVHRIPTTESGGRIHTSTATVAVLPIVTAKEVTIRTEDLRVDTYRAGGKGGQHVNKTESAIRITHLPTNVVVQCQDERSQLKNRERAMSMLRSKLFEMMKHQQKNNLDEIRADQVGTGDRSEKIRTYNFPQDRVTDHRIKKSWFGMNRILAGQIDDILSDVKESIQNGEIADSDDSESD